MRLSMRVFHPAILIVLLAIASASLSQCVISSSQGLNADEADARKALNQILVDAATCPAVSLATQKACQARGQTITTLKASALGLKTADIYCVYAGKDTANKPLTAAVKANYTAHAKFWGDLAAVIPDADDGTFVVSDTFHQSYLDLDKTPIALPIPAPTTPTISTKIVDGTTVLQVQAQKVDAATYPNQATLQVCVFTGTPPTDPDCTKAKAPSSTPSVAPASILGGADGKTKVNFIDADSSGSTKITLATAITAGNTVYIIEKGTDAASGAQQAISKAYPVTVSQCNKDVPNHPYSDCDWNFSIVGGIEQSGLAAQASQTGGFLRVFTRAGPNNNFQLFGAIRLLSAPSQSNSNGVVSAFTDPTGTITSQSLLSVGYAIDYSLGFETLPWFHSNRMWSVSTIGEFGGTTPLTANTIAAAYKAPAYGTVECQEFYQRFQSYFTQKTYNIILGTPTNVTQPSSSSGSTTTPVTACLVNTNDPTTTGTTTTYAPISNIGFSNQDRSAFLGKWFVGVRTIDRFRQKNAVACGDPDPANSVAPCARGVVDVLFGADASINRGVFRPWVFKVEAVHPLLIKDTSYLYIFGSFSVRIAGNVNLPPLVLQPGDPSALSGTGATPVPNVNTVVLPLTQPDRDFYRFGVGLDIGCIFTKLFGKTPDCSAFPSTGTSASGSS